MAIVPRHLPAAVFAIPKELHGVVVLASPSAAIALAHRDGLPSMMRVELAALAPPEKNRRSVNPDFGQNGSKKHTKCLTTDVWGDDPTVRGFEEQMAAELRR